LALSALPIKQVLLKSEKEGKKFVRRNNDGVGKFKVQQRKMMTARTTAES
jgi:hypothetical protein